MTKNYLTFTKEFNVSDGTSTTLPNSYINLKLELMDTVKQQIAVIFPDFTFLQETTPLATAAAQVLDIFYNTPLVCNETGNWIFRVRLDVGAFSSASSLTLKSDFVRSTATVAAMIPIQSATAATGTVIATWATNPAQINTDIESVLARSESIISVGVTRANFITVTTANIFASAAYCFFRYKVLQTGDIRWGGVSNSVANQPLQTILAPASSAVTSLGISQQAQFGFIPSATAEWNCLEMPVVYWNETAVITSPLMYSFESGADNDSMFVSSPAMGTIPAITQGQILNPTGTLDDYYVVNVFLGKMALVKITG